MGLFSRFHKNEQKNNSESVSLSPEEKFKKMVPANPGIALNDDEVCLFMSDASIGKEKTRTTGYKSSGVSSRIHIAKGLSVGSSNVHVTPTRETYWEKTPCRFFVTDKRFIAISQKGGFNLKADKIIDMKLNADAVTLYTGSKTYIVFMTSEDVHRYKELWETIQSLQRNGIDPKKIVEIKGNDIMALLNFIDGLFKGDKTKTKPPVRNSTATQKRYYADSSSVAIEERQYYQQDSYYTLVVHEGTQFEKKVIPFNERKTVTYPSKNGLYVPEILLLEYCKYGKYPKPSNGYPGFWWFDYGVRDVGSLLDSLRSREFIKWERKGNLLMNLNVNELREILRAHCLSTTGKKGELIERIKSDIAEEDLPNNVALQKYTLTEKGIEELKENAYVPYMHNHRHKTTDDSTFGEPFTVWEMNKIIAAEGRQKEWKTIVGEIEKQRFAVNMAGSQGTTQNLRTTQEVPSEKENKGEELKRFLRENRKNIIAAANTEGDGFFEESKGLDYCTIGNDKEALYQFYVAIEKKFDAPALYKETAKLLHKYGLYDEEVKVLKKGVAIVPATNRHREELLKMLQDAMTISKTR